MPSFSRQPSVSGGLTGRKKSILLTDNAAEMLLSSAAVNPPSLTQRAYDNSTLFLYYSQRGAMELMTQPKPAVESCVDHATSKFGAGHRSTSKGEPMVEGDPSSAFGGGAGGGLPEDSASGRNTSPSPGTGVSSGVANDTEVYFNNAPLFRKQAPQSTPSQSSAAALLFSNAAGSAASGTFGRGSSRQSTARKASISVFLSGVAAGEAGAGGAGGGGLSQPPGSSAFATSSVSPRHSVDPARLLSERHLVVPSKRHVAEPLFPRLRPVASEDNAAFLLQLREEQQAAVVKQRSSNAKLPPVEVMYSTMYRPPDDLTRELEASLRAMVKKGGEEDDRRAASQAAAASAANLRTLGNTNKSPTYSQSNNNTSYYANNNNPSNRRSGAATTNNASISPHAHRGGDSPSSQAHDFDADTLSIANHSDTNAPAMPPSSAINAGGLSAPQDGAGCTPYTHRQPGGATLAAEHREAVNRVAEETVQVFVAAHQILHPDEQAEAERSRRASRISAALSGGDASGKKKKKKKKAVKPPQPGEPHHTLQLFKYALYDACDENGCVSLARLEALLREVPFELTNTEAIRLFFQDVVTHDGGSSAAEEDRSSVANLGVTASAVGEVEDSMATGSPPPAGSAAAGISSTALHRSPTRPDVAMDNSISTSVSKKSISTGLAMSQQTDRGGVGAGGRRRSNTIRASASGGSDQNPGSRVNIPPPPTVLPLANVRDVLAAIDELLNGTVTRNVVRWCCFSTLAEEGQGYIHKNILENYKKIRREEIELPTSIITPSIVKALLDCFDVIAADEEVAYFKSISKGRRKKKPPPLAPHQKSAIPLHVMRRAHIPYKEFCEFFDRLPQLPAAFAHVWLPLLVAGHVSPVGGDGRRFAPSAPDDPFQDHTATPLLASTKVLGGAVDASISASTSTSQRVTMMTSDASGGVDDEHEVEPGTYPLSLLGSSSLARVSLVHRTIAGRMSLMRRAHDELKRMEELFAANSTADAGQGSTTSGLPEPPH